MKTIAKKLLQQILLTGLATSVPFACRARCEFWLNKKLTKFDIGAITRRIRSKKARSDSINVRAGGDQAYRYSGKILKFRRSHNGANNAVLIRNVVELASFEITIPVLSPLVTNAIYPRVNVANTRGNAYYLRTAAPVKSKTEFKYIIENE